jgi:hypothetical protein
VRAVTIVIPFWSNHFSRESLESEEIQCLKDHLSTPDCREAIVRISMYDKKGSGMPPDEMEIELKLTCIENLRINRVQNLNITMNELSRIESHFG